MNKENGNNPIDQPEEMPAVRTTIVGGRPPGSGKPVGNIPRGIEVLVKKAAIDPEFRQELIKKRSQAAVLIGLELNPTETAMLDSIPDSQLHSIIRSTRVSPSLTKAFMSYTAAIMLAALGCQAHSAIDPDEHMVTKGIDPDTEYLNNGNQSGSEQPTTETGKYLGILAGIVTDPQRKPIANALVTVTQLVDDGGLGLSGGGSYEGVVIAGLVVEEPTEQEKKDPNFHFTHSDEKGTYQIKDLPAGNYTMKVTCQGYQTVTKTPLGVAAGLATTLNVIMKINTNSGGTTGWGEGPQIGGIRPQ